MMAFCTAPSAATGQGIVYHFGPVRFANPDQFDTIMPGSADMPKVDTMMGVQMIRDLTAFLHDENGAVTVDWTMLSAAAVGLSLATAAMLTGTLEMVISRVDNELRTQQLSDDFVQFTAAHFEPLLEHGSVDGETLENLFTIANGMMNQEILDSLEWGLEQMQAGSISSADMAALYAVASVAYQRNLVPDQILESYFGFEPGASGGGGGSDDSNASSFATNS
jgi:Flp pilus assembly pilin Flp